MSPGISGGKQVIKFDKTSSYHSRVFLFIKREDDSSIRRLILEVQNEQPEFCHYYDISTSLLFAVRTSSVATVYKKVKMTSSTPNLPLLYLR